MRRPRKKSSNARINVGSPATTTAQMAIETYLKTSYHPDCDFVDGEIEERNLGEFDHAALQAAIVAYFYPNRQR